MHTSVIRRLMLSLIFLLPMTLKSILLICAHPALHRSRVNRRMIEAVSDLPHVRVHDLYETYPDFHINLRHEQALLEHADLVIFQHPIQWYSMPALLKEWMDVVLEYGWAYGKDGTALRGKDYWLAATTGGNSHDYSTDGTHGHSFEAFLPPLQQTANLCGMNWVPPFLLFGALQVDEVGVKAHCQRYRELLQTYPDWAKLPTTPMPEIKEA
ncbi:NAD(P)H-dependent oxidoreductase [Undibacterium sp. Jales W-56]|uniref:glutathione-regulated potassium-efflux system oxidoreductase KefF n=1 Tax=Undibacterium sp. Jales W-56 TaxID=2897325 RepID=UPI0021D16BBC|nr:NAD(P)H-dependent oxidoreductase [Undibacterium sp. Jales W-56]MCU6433945.1 NAD(P)H-dependent oxidoreductase [Undibacterium sp. Jales W-56]